MKSQVPQLGRVARLPKPLKEPLPSQIRCVDGARSPYFNAMKRGVELKNDRGSWRLELREQRTIVFPWLRLPLWTYWRVRVVHCAEVAPCEVVARVFLETGHVPSEWFL